MRFVDAGKYKTQEQNNTEKAEKETKEAQESVHKKEELKYIYRVWSGYTRYLRSQAVQGRCINCPFIGKFVKRQSLEEGQRKFGGPKRGDQPFTTNVLPNANPPSTSYDHKKYVYFPAMDFIDSANLIYKEDIENLSPLHKALGLKVVQMSYSSIAVSCNTNKTTVLNCLKEIFSTILTLLKNGSEITLDLKIGTLNILSGKKLMFRNYNPDVVIDKQKGTSQSQARSRLSEVPTSVATPFTNVESTLSYHDRTYSQEVSARQAYNHVGIKRSGPSYQFNSENNMLDGEKLYYRHKKNPYNNIENFIMDNRSDIDTKIQNLKNKERQKMLNSRKNKHKKGLSNSFLNFHNEHLRNTFNNSSYQNGHAISPFAPERLLNKTGNMSAHSNSMLDTRDLNDKEPSTVNDKLPSRFVIDYPNFLKPAKYHPYRRLEEHHVADALQEARRRHESNLVKIKKEDEVHTDLFFKAVEKNKKQIMDVEVSRKK